MTEAAKAEQKRYMQEYRQQNRDKVNEYQRNWRHNHPEKVREYNAGYWERKAAAAREEE